MHSALHQMRRLARLVLAWYVLFLGVSVLAATLQPKTLDVVCSSMGIMKVVVHGEGGDAKVSAGMDCPLCASVTAPPSPVSVHFEKLSPLAHALQPVAAAHIASVTAPPLPSRGPPASSL